MYLTYAEFTEKGGTELSEAAFSRYEYRAEKEIDRYTQKRLSSSQPSEAVKRCMVEIIELLCSTEEAGKDNVASVSNDGMSVSYRDMRIDEKGLSQKIHNIVIMYLPEYCYRGVDDV